MRTIVSGFFCLLLILSSFILYGQADDKLAVSVSSGYQEENLNWSLAGNIYGQNPNIYSELKWKRLAGPAASLNFKWNVLRIFFILGNYSYASITTGTVTDTDYGTDNRSSVIYHGDFNDNKGHTDLGYIGLGFKALNRKHWNVALGIGYTLAHQSLYILGVNGTNPTLNTRYATKWSGGFLKGYITWLITDKIKLQEEIVYSQLNYSANANWNLINQFAHPVSYTDEANGYGIYSDTRVVYKLAAKLEITINGGYHQSETGKGVDQLFLANGTSENTQFNKGVYNAYGLELGLVFMFE